MNNSDQSELITKALMTLFDETFDNVHGYYLDKGTSLFETLATISAEEASIPVGGKCATLAAQVKHVAFYLEVTEKSVRNPDFPKANWGEIWRNVNNVTPKEWKMIQDELRLNYHKIKELIMADPAWKSDVEISGAIAVILHTAYHLGEIRQALCSIRS